MEEIEKAMLLLDLEEQVCQLSHGPHPSPEAEGYLVETLKTESGHKELTIPICKECSDSLVGGRWVLCYCLKCNESRWIDRLFCKNELASEKRILWLQGCPECGGKFDGLWFG